MRPLKLIALGLAFCGPGLASAATEPEPMFHMTPDLSDTESLQRGAHTFVNYCASCHSASLMRYGRIADDLDLPPEVVKDNMMFTTDKIGDTIKVAMKPEDSKKWFGVTPPDLSVIARVRGADWLYSFLLSYYVDPKSVSGWNNLMFPNTAMPHPMSNLQGTKRLAEKDESDSAATTGLETMAAGVITEGEYETKIKDLVNFLVYMGEPAGLERRRMGYWVIGFLLVFAFLSYQLKKEYWKDVH